MENIKELLEPFDLSVGSKQDLLSIFVSIENSKFSFEEIISHLRNEKAKFVKNFKQDQRDKREYEKIAIRCPECEAVMFLYHVNNKPNVQVGEGLKSQWYCLKCAHTIFNKKSIQEILKERRR
ncbi:MAG: hypothetical protein KAJ19_26475 [Gammaproteobacteria bacterium]|nr:hypothetical protein [Gammaproteobacteria bacterium]